MYRVCINFEMSWYPIGPMFSDRGDAEWAIASWRQAHGSNGHDTGFRVEEVIAEEETASIHHDDDDIPF